MGSDRRSGKTPEGRLARWAPWERWVPGIRMLREYELAWLSKDLAAGVTLGIADGTGRARLRRARRGADGGPLRRDAAARRLRPVRQLATADHRPGRFDVGAGGVERGAARRRRPRAPGDAGLGARAPHGGDPHRRLVPAPGLSRRLPGQAGHHRFHARPGGGDRRRPAAQGAGCRGRGRDHGRPVSDRLAQSRGRRISSASASAPAASPSSSPAGAGCRASPARSWRWSARRSSSTF